jgi:hypothetical protein
VRNIATSLSFCVAQRSEWRTHTGTITIEGGWNQTLLDGGPVYHAGFLEAWMDSITFDRGEFYLVSFAGSDANGAVNVAFQPHEISMVLEPDSAQCSLDCYQWWAGLCYDFRREIRRNSSKQAVHFHFV